MEFKLKRCEECKRYFIDLFKCPCCGSDNVIDENEVGCYDEEFDKIIKIYEQLDKIIHNISNISIFIGSTSESLKNAKYLGRCLLFKQHMFKAVKILLWDKDVFDIGETTIESLIRTSKMADMAIFVFTGEDTLITRKKCYNTVRDNLLFEYGLFIGKVGIRKVFILMEENKNIKLPSDLYGINYIPFDSETKMDLIAETIAQKAKNIFIEKVNTYLIKYCESLENEYEEVYKNQIKK